MVCHYCGHEKQAKQAKKAKKVCPSCGSPYIGAFRAGTQQVVEVVHREFPGARVLRMDMDTTRNKNSHEKILEAFAEGKADILVGTQMIVKGHDFPAVTLVGVLAADLSLYTNDYRASERTFQLLTQAAGRAGRGREEGTAVIQTYSPEHYSIKTAAAQDYELFFQNELAYRRLMEYPPAAQLLALYLSGKEKEGAGVLKEILGKQAEGRDIQIIGPADAYVPKVNDIYRKVVYLKGRKPEQLTELKGELEIIIWQSIKLQQLSIQFDMNPMNGF